MTGRAAPPTFAEAADRLHHPASRAVAAALVAVAGPAAVTLLALGTPHEAVPALL
jgi:hypothetical protein